jgi:pimeloyl-ACP methyl ester carboxylesterase
VNQLVETRTRDFSSIDPLLADGGGHAWSGPMSWVLPWATIAWGGSLAIIVGRDGEWPWILTRLAVVGVLLSIVLWAVQCRRSAVTGAITAGLLGVVVGGGIGVPHILRSGDVVLASSGMISLLAGLALLVCGATTLLRRRGRVGRCAGGLGLMIVTALIALIFVPAVMATNVPATDLDKEDPAFFGLSFENVTFDTSDGVTLSAWYIPSTNDAAVVIRHGSGSTRSDVLPQTLVLAHHGYGVLLVDARGHGLSEGRAMDFGWFGDADTSAAVTFLSNRVDVDPARIGVVGMSMGGEEAIGAAASDPRIRAVVAEGATGRTDADESWLSDVYGARGTVQEGIEWLRYSIADLLTSAPKPISLSGAIERASSTPFLLIAAGTVSDEREVAESLALSAPGEVSVWVVPGSRHTQGLIVAPTEWEQRVVAFLDRHIGAGSTM